MSVKRKILFATCNEGKMREIRSIMADLGVPVLSMKEAGLLAQIDENGATFEENALIKARGAAALAEPDSIVLADDSGLEIDALNKEPGVYSARYMGDDTPYSVKNADLLRRMDGVPKEKRTARFVCAISAVFPDGREFTVRETVEGMIGYEQKGDGGFGYDPIFYVPEFGKTMAELSAGEKNRISHRGKALELMKEVIKRNESFDCQ